MDPVVLQPKNVGPILNNLQLEADWISISDSVSAIL